MRSDRIQARAKVQIADSRFRTIAIRSGLAAGIGAGVLAAALDLMSGNSWGSALPLGAVCLFACGLGTYARTQTLIRRVNATRAKMNGDSKVG